jgi:hypothetical protein
VLGLLRRIGKRIPAEREPRVVDEDVDASELRERALDERGAAVRIRDVQLKRDVGLDRVDAPSAAGDAGTRLAQRARRCRSRRR